MLTTENDAITLEAIRRVYEEQGAIASVIDMHDSAMEAEEDGENL